MISYSMKHSSSPSDDLKWVVEIPDGRIAQMVTICPSKLMVFRHNKDTVLRIEGGHTLGYVTSADAFTSSYTSFPPGTVLVLTQD